MGKKHIIELNGKRYDTLTGEIIKAQAATKTKPKISKLSVAKNMDGFAKRKHQTHPAPKSQHRPTEKSHTLMRKMVNKPVNHKLHAVATIIDQRPVRSSTLSQPPSTVKKAPAKSKLIRRFGSITPVSPVKNALNQSVKSTVIPTTSTLSQVALNAATVVLSPLDQAIANATSHQQPKLKRRTITLRISDKLHVTPRIVSAGAATFAILLIAGFFGYQNIPNLKMRLASSRAGLHGTLPAYQPPGFRLQDISYKTGQINIGFRSNSDSRNFTVSQVSSSWNSDTLRDKLKTTGQAPMPVEVPDKGKTLFIYNESSVTWVDGGILYKIEGDSKLNSAQLLSLANSL